jgi:hypothetical protein
MQVRIFVSEMVGESISNLLLLRINDLKILPLIGLYANHSRSKCYPESNVHS